MDYGIYIEGKIFICPQNSSVEIFIEKCKEIYHQLDEQFREILISFPDLGLEYKTNLQIRYLSEIIKKQKLFKNSKLLKNFIEEIQQIIDLNKIQCMKNTLSNLQQNIKFYKELKIEVINTFRNSK